MSLPPVQPPGPVSIRLLGQFGVSVGGEAPHAQLTRRAAELVQLLSLQPQRSLLNEQVVEALWPHLDPEAGSANLRKAAHHARQFVGEPDALVLRGGRVFLLPDRGVDCDALRFEQAADEALAGGNPQACKAAAQLYGGDLLPDARYETWTEAPRQRLRGKYLRLLREAGDLERLVQEDPTDEAAHVQLMREELAAGRRSSALRWWGHLRDHLQQAMGLRPGPQAEALYRECVAGMEGAAPRFVGRALELVRVLTLLRAGLAGRARRRGGARAGRHGQDGLLPARRRGSARPRLAGSLTAGERLDPALRDCGRSGGALVARVAATSCRPSARMPRRCWPR